MMKMVLQKCNKCLDVLYVIYVRCMDDKKDKHTSGFEVRCWKLQMCNNGGFLVILSLRVF